MTDLKPPIYRPYNLDREVENSRKDIARSKEVLALPAPDTFLGRVPSEAVLPRYEDGSPKGEFSLDDARPLQPPAAEGNRAALIDLLGVLVQAAVEQANGEARAAFYLANSGATMLHHITGMTREYARYVDGFAIGPGSLACGLAAATRHAVITPDVIEDPSWSRWRWLANQFGYRACWSFPVESKGKILGTFAMYYKEPTEAGARDLEFASLISRTAAKIISKR